MINNPKIRVGIIGASVGKGWASVSHIPALSKLNIYELIAVSTTNKDSAAASQKEFNAKYGFDNFEDLIKHPEIDLVVVAVKTPDHYAIVKMALANNKHVYCEWPLGNGIAETQELAALSVGNDQICTVGLQGRYSPAINQIKKIIENGEIGEIISSTMIASAGEVFGGTVSAGNAYMCDKNNGATMVTIQLGHFSDSFCYVLGEFRSLSSTFTTHYLNVKIVESGEFIKCDSPDHININGVLRNGADAMIEIRGGQPLTENFIWLINGTLGDLKITADNGYVHMVELKITIATKNDPKPKPVTIASEFKKVDGEDRNAPSYTLSHFYDALSYDIINKQQSIPSFKDALLRYTFLETVQEAARSGVRVSTTEQIS